jgi:DNA-binding response OmpR family regulator
LAAQLIRTESEPARLLLAEDDFELRRLLIWALSKDGYQIVEIANGSELVHRLGLSLLESGKLETLDLIITDVRMPGWSGLEVLEALRTVGCQTPVIIMTAFGDAEVHQKALNLGAACVLDKPVDLDHLRWLVVRTLQAFRPRPDRSAVRQSGN